MPTSAKRKPRKGGEEFFVLDDNHDRQDNVLHDPILDGGDHAAARSVSIAVMKRLGLSAKQIAALTKEKT
ncbi:hypothetical protein [Bradyrhizobium sp. S3.7.6]